MAEKRGRHHASSSWDSGRGRLLCRRSLVPAMTWIIQGRASRFSAHKPGPVIAVVFDVATVAFYGHYVGKSITQRFPYFFRRECYCPDDFRERLVPTVSLDLK